MKVKQMLVVGALALATGAVFAQESSGASVSRDQVADSVINARAAGTLTPAGQGVDPGYGGAGPSQRSRAAVSADVLKARAAGDLVPASGNSPSAKVYNKMIAAPSTLTRDQVRAEVLAARVNGTLIPAGQGEYSGPDSAVYTARHVAPAPEVVAAHAAK